ncbi:MAG: hypothetical protein SNH94_05920 [Rikenellaceae bacterium]
MKKIVYSIITSLALLFSSCEENESMLQPNGFSDVSFICSQLINQWSDNVIEVGTPISFMDLSQGAVTHTWTIEESCSLLYGEYSENDTEYDQYIIPGGVTVSEDVTAFVLFNEPGNDVGVKINNSFKDEVTYTAFPDDLTTTVTFPFEWTVGSTYNSSTGLWDFEAEYIFKVLDKVDASVEIYAGDTLIASVDKGVFGDDSEVESWETVEVTTDDIIKIVADVYGEPETMNLYFSSYLKSYESMASTTETISTNPKITRLTNYYFPSSLQTFELGYMRLVRSSGDTSTGISTPASSVTKTLPLCINVSMGENDLSATPTVTDFDEITFALSAVVNSLPSTVTSDFIVEINNPDKYINNEKVEVSSVALNSTKTAFVVNLAGDIYIDDQITITYAPTDKAITDTYGRELASFVTDEQPEFFDPVITDPVNRGFEGTVNSTTSVDGWYLQHYLYWGVSAEQAHTGSYSMKYYNEGVDGSSTDYWACQSAAADSELSGDAGTYIFKAWVYVTEDTTLTEDVSIALQYPTGTLVSTTSTILDAPRGEWFEIEREYTVATEFIVATSKINLKMINTNVGTVYFDDISLERKQTRP